MSQQYTIYTLLLENGKYYVGKTLNPDKRIMDHFEGNGSVWTTIHKPLEIVSVIQGDDYDEEKYTLIAMEKYGIDNVRGGSYCQANITKQEKDKILHIIRSNTNKCFECGEEGHFSKNCKSKGNNSVICYKCSGRGHYANACKSNLGCYKCGRKGHYAKDCNYVQPKIYDTNYVLSKQKCDECILF